MLLVFMQFGKKNLVIPLIVAKSVTESDCFAGSQQCIHFE